MSASYNPVGHFQTRHVIFPCLLICIWVAGVCWSLSKLSRGERQGTPAIGRQPIAGLAQGTGQGRARIRIPNPEPSCCEPTVPTTCATTPPISKDANSFYSFSSFWNIQCVTVFAMNFKHDNPAAKFGPAFASICDRCDSDTDSMCRTFFLMHPNPVSSIRLQTRNYFIFLWLKRYYDASDMINWVWHSRRSANN